MRKMLGLSEFVWSAVVALAWFATLVSQAAANGPQLSMLILKGEDAIVGEITRETDAEITVDDIEAGKERAIPKSRVTEVRRDLSDNVAIANTDLASVTAWKASRLSPTKAVVGKVAKISDNIIYTTLGSKDRLAKGQTLNVYRDAGEIVDPETKKVIGRDRPRIAQLEVVEVQETFAKSKLAGELEVKLSVGDEVETIPKSVAVAVLPLVDASGKETEAGTTLAEHLTASLVSKRVPVVERGMLDDAIRELALQRTVLFERESVQKLGKQVGASMVLTGKILADGKVNRAFVRMFDVETGEVVLTSSQVVHGSAPTAAAAPAGDRSRDDAKPSARGGGGAAVAAAGAARTAAAGPPPDEKIIAEDKHVGLATNHPSFTKANVYVMKIEPDVPLVRVAATNIYAQAQQPDDKPNTQGNIQVSIDYGKTWIHIAKWDTATMKRAKRMGNWHVFPLAAAFKKKPDTEIDEIHVRFDVEGQVEGIQIETVIWAKK